MSDPNANQATSTPPQPGAAAAPAAPAPTPGGPQSAPHAAAAGREKRGSTGKLSTFLKISIILLAGLTVASISLLFIGTFEGRFERVFSTFALFAVFVLLTAFDTRRGQKSEWYSPVALIANAYILALLLLVIWMTRYDPYSLMWEIFWKSVYVILVIRLVILCCQLLLRAGDRLPPAVTRFAFVTSVLAVLSGILFTAPAGIAAFDLSVPELYWKIATALLILTALALSITLLLRWAYGSDAREAARASRVSAVPPAPYRPGELPSASAPEASAATSAGHAATGAPSGAVPGQRPLLPWPTFPDGRPLPVGPDGQPDFSALGPGSGRR